MIALLLMVIIFVFNMINGYKNTKKTIFINYFIIMAYPIITFEIVGFDSTKYITYKRINLFHIIILSLLIITIIKSILLIRNKKKINFINVLFYCLTLSYLIYFFLGYSQYGNIALQDLSYYIFPFALYYITIKNLEQDSLHKFIKITLIGTFTNSIITLILYVCKLRNLLGPSARFGNGGQSIYMITIPIMVFVLFMKQYKNIRFKIILAILVESYLQIVTQNRTNPVMIILSIIMIIIVISLPELKNNKLYISKTIKGIYLLIVCIFVFCILIISLESANIAIMNRYKEAMINKTQSGNYLIRKINESYYLDQNINKPFGHYFGSVMPMITKDNVVAEETQNSMHIDNAILTYFYKLGINNLIMYILIYLISYINLLKFSRNQNGYICIIISIIFPFFLIGTGYFTSQILHNQLIYSFIWMLFGIVNTRPIKAIENI